MADDPDDLLFTPSEYEFLSAMGALCRDAGGQLVLLGLTFEETRAYLAGHRGSMLAAPNALPDPRYLALSLRHHEALRAALAPKD